MNTTTTTKSILGAILLATMAVLPGCIEPLSATESDGASDEEEPTEVGTGESEQPLEVADGNTFRLKVKHSRDCMQPVGAIPGTPLVQRDCTSGPPASNDPQSFERIVAANGAIRLKHVMTGLCVYIAGPSMDNGGGSVLLTCDVNRLNGTFAEGPLDAEQFRSLTVTDSGKCLAIIGQYHGDGVLLYQWGTNCTYDHTKFHFDYDSAVTP